MNKYFGYLVKISAVIFGFSVWFSAFPEPVVAQSCSGQIVMSQIVDDTDVSTACTAPPGCNAIHYTEFWNCNADCTVRYKTGNCWYNNPDYVCTKICVAPVYVCWDCCWCVWYWRTYCMQEKCDTCCGWTQEYCYDSCSYTPGRCGYANWLVDSTCTPDCEPVPVTCDSCSAACGGGTQSCTDGCDTWSQACNGQACIPECSLDLQPSSATLARGDDASFIAAVSNIQYGTVERVAFSSSDSSVANVAPGSDTTVVYQTEANGKTEGTVTVTAEAIMAGVVRCSDTSTLELVSPGPWWQVKDSDVITNGNLVSDVPLGEYFGLDGAGGYPGVAVYGGSTDLLAGRISSKSWLANSTSPSLSTRLYDYDWFDRQVPADTKITAITETTVDGSFFESGQLLSLRP